MLVLSRKTDASIMVGDDVKITIVDVRGDKVRLGIEAPKDIPVHRQEVYDSLQRERAELQDASLSKAPAHKSHCAYLKGGICNCGTFEYRRR